MNLMLVGFHAIGKTSLLTRLCEKGKAQKSTVSKTSGCLEHLIFIKGIIELHSEVFYFHFKWERIDLSFSEPKVILNLNFMITLFTTL